MNTLKRASFPSLSQSLIQPFLLPQGPRGLLGPHSPISPSLEQKEERGYF